MLPTMSLSRALLILCCNLLVISPSMSQVNLGRLTTLYRSSHNKTVLLLNENQIQIIELQLGPGEGLRFMIGKDTDKYKEEFTILQGVILPTLEGDCGPLRQYDSESFELFLPKGMKMKFTDFDYFAIFCIKTNHNYAYVTIPKGTVAPPPTTPNPSIEIPEACDQHPADRNNSVPSTTSAPSSAQLSGQLVLLWICVSVTLGFFY